MNLSSQKCIPCEVGGEPMSAEERDMYMKDLPHWKLADDTKSISRQFKFKDFKEAMAFVNKIADIAENEGHHPDIRIVYNKVTVELTTHAVGGLTLNDMVIAAKIDKVSV